MARSLRKGPFVAPSLRKAEKRDSKKPIKTYSRASVILTGFVGRTVHVHNGKKFIPVSVSEAHVGHKFGEFAPTRVLAKHVGKKKGK